jgi:uncharacterized protein YbjT (DUF2867 family)
MLTVCGADTGMGGMGLAWKLRAEEVVQASGVPYVIVRPVGLKNNRDLSATCDRTHHAALQLQMLVLRRLGSC